jgi:hypothetical protein
LTKEDLVAIIKKKLGFTSKKAEVLSGLAIGTSLDIFSRAGEALKYRDMAIELISNMKKRHLEDSIDYIDKIEKNDLPLFSDMITFVLNDLILLKNNYMKITNMDKKDDLIKVAESYNVKALIWSVGVFSQVKRYLFLNINLNLYLKNSIIKTHPLLKV